MPKWPLERRTTEAVTLAAISLAAVGCLRFPVESRVMFVAEMITIAILATIGIAKKSGRQRPAGDPDAAGSRTTQMTGNLASVFLVATPIAFACIGRLIGSPIPFEMSALTAFGVASLALALRRQRLQAMSLVASGFLTLFAVAISDDRQAVAFAIAWMSICVWHLVTNHWERLETCCVDRVHRRSGVRPASVIVAIAICVASGLVVRDRFGESQRFTFGFMPTSGGSKWSDPAALSGVGTGDAAIAARDHAESFGAVESDLFLESTESTLFDMFSDMLGEPKKKKNKWERRQGLTADRVLEAHQKTAKTEKGGSSFSTDRMAAKKHLKLNDADENAVIQWAGPTGIRLAMNRYDTFDGVDWTNQATHRNEKLVRQEHDGQAWFLDPSHLASLARSSPQVALLKILRLDSTRLPTPMMTTGLHIKDVDRQDFFGIEDDGSFFMPGRDKVPALTVINVVSTSVMQDEIWDGLSPGQSTVADHDVAAVAASVTAAFDHPYEKLGAIVSHLRDEFTFDRNAESASADPVAGFLQTRRGGDHLFATTAALMARRIGLQSRLVTGFYVRPSAIDIAAGHANVTAEDVHVWVEIRLDDGRWFEIEPTPGFRQPIYTPSAWLSAKQFAAARWPHAIGLLVLAGLCWWTRMLWIELSLGLLYRIGAAVWPRGRIPLAMRVLQTRARLAGCPRAAGIPQRDWLLSLTAARESLCDRARRFCDAADRAAFGGGELGIDDSLLSKELLVELKIKAIRELSSEAFA